MSERFQANTSHCPGKCRTEADFGIRYRDMGAGLPVYAPGAGDCQQEADFRGRIRLYWQESLRPELCIGNQSWGRGGKRLLRAGGGDLPLLVLIVTSNSETYTGTIAMGSPELWHRGSTKIAITVPNRLVRRVSCCGSFKWVLRAAALYASEFPALPFLCRKDKGGLHYWRKPA